MTRRVDPRRWGVSRVVAAFVASASVLPAGTAQAQGYAREVVQPLPDPATPKLNEALRALSSDPRSLPALIAAGQASLALDNVEAALGFFRRAEAIAPYDGAVKAGLASVLVHQRQPVEALRLFAEAEAAGEPMQPHAAERGLAYDLVGDNTRAQQDYRTALAAGTDPVVIRRLALSQAIAGDQRGSEATLLPLLQRSDLSAFRTRAFALAILGKSEEAVSIAETMLPERLSSRLSPYLRFMPRLTRAQQASAANLGVFPQAAEIGRDGPELAAYASPLPVPAAPAADAGARLVPAGEPLGPRPSVALAAAEPLPPPAAAPAPVMAVTLPLPALVEPSRPSILPAGEPSAAPRAVEVIQLSEVFAEFSLPAAAAAPAPGSVDITRIEPRREARSEPAPARAAPPPVPSREWVQVATGRDVAALAFDWRRIRRNAGGLLDNTAPHVAKWGQTNRLVAGPFASASEARDMVARLKAKNLDSFRFTSARGEAVEPLD